MPNTQGRKPAARRLAGEALAIAATAISRWYPTTDVSVTPSHQKRSEKPLLGKELRYNGLEGSAMPNAGNSLKPAATSPQNLPFRVFISYSHEDADLVRVIAEVLDENGMVALYDKKGLQIGAGFPQEIINFITHAHVFMPLLTRTSLKRRWVQQEIGFAVASRVPTAPVAVNCEPGEFLYGIEAVRLRTLDRAELKRRLTRKALETCVSKYPLGGALYECAATTEERAVLLAQYARAVTLMGGSGIVRQLGGLSSYHIPAETVDHPVWQLRYGEQHQSEFHRKVLREERLALTEHAKEKGCRMVIEPNLEYQFYGGDARRTRLECLLKFLRSMPDRSCQVAMAAHGMRESITIVGDWFAAHSIYGKMGEGYRQTIFTRHAPTIAKMIEEFDRRFDQHLGGVPVGRSRRNAIAEIERRIADLSATPATQPDKSR